MAHQYTYEELHRRIDEASKRIELGARYIHTKTGGEYIAKEFVTIEATEELAITYQSLKDKAMIFVRPVDDFTAKVEIDGKIVNRFTKVN